MKKLFLLLALLGMVATGCSKDEVDKGNDNDNKIYYTTSDNTKLFPKTDAPLYGAILISNTYKDGQGVLVFDDAVTTIGDEAFDHCSSLTSVTIPNSVTTIGDGAFAWCSSLTSVTIGNSVTTIGEEVFYFCSSLTSVTIPDSVTSIGDSAFGWCYSLTSVTIGDSVTWIGEGAFSWCESLTSVYCKPTTPPAGSSDMFYDNASGRMIYVPMESVEAYKSASYWSEYASAIVGYNF